MSARRISSLVGVGLIALIVLFAVSGGEDGADRSRLLGRRVPELSGQTLDGEKYSIDNSRGDWVLVNFFATWCVGCVREHPELVELEQWGRDNGLEVVSVVFDDDTDRVRAFFEKQGGEWPVLQDPSAAVTFQIAQIPESFLVSQNGVVIQHTIGGVSAADIKAVVEGG